MTQGTPRNWHVQGPLKGARVTDVFTSVIKLGRAGGIENKAGARKVPGKVHSAGGVKIHRWRVIVNNPSVLGSAAEPLPDFRVSINKAKAARSIVIAGGNVLPIGDSRAIDA